MRLISTNWPIIGALYLPLHDRIARAHQRFARLASGKYPSPRPARPNQPGGSRPIYIPHQRDWIIVKFGYRAAAYSSQLNHLLSEPQTQAILAAAPPHARASATRTLAPLCRMLGIPLPPIVQPAPKPPRPSRAKTPRPKLPPLLPLSASVMSLG